MVGPVVDEPEPTAREDSATDVGSLVLAFATRVERLRREMEGLRGELEALAGKRSADAVAARTASR